VLDHLINMCYKFACYVEKRAKYTVMGLGTFLPYKRIIALTR